MCVIQGISVRYDVEMLSNKLCGSLESSKLKSSVANCCQLLSWSSPPGSISFSSSKLIKNGYAELETRMTSLRFPESPNTIDARTRFCFRVPITSCL